jgi:hypothetical protein
MFTKALEEMATLPDAAVDERIREFELQSRSVQAELSAAVHLAAARGTYRDDGHRTMPACQRAAWNASDAEVSRQRKIGAVCGAIPSVGDALASGRIAAAHHVAGRYTNDFVSLTEPVDALFRPSLTRARSATVVWLGPSAHPSVHDLPNLAR